jgi:hypothetical protein
MDAQAFAAGREFSKKREAEAERLRKESQETQSLRKLMAIYQPERKDQFTAMGLPDLRAEAEGFVTKNKVVKEQREAQAAEQQRQSAAALMQVLQDAGSLNEQEVLAEGRGPVRQTRQPVAMTPQRLQTVLARNPAAVNAENFAPNINALRALLTDTTASADAGMPESATMGESDVIFNRKTGQFQISPFSKAAANKKEAEGYIELPDEEDPLYGPRIRLPLSQARDKYPHLLKRLESGANGKAASQYPDANAVKAALKSGQIKKDEAIKILREQFGYK